jgi:transcriptional regulator with XRE-family HTH domain
VAAPRSVRHVAYGEAFRQLRAERRLSQEALASEADLDRTYVSGIERGERNPSLESILKLTDALEVQLSEVASLAETLLERCRDFRPPG